MYTRESKLPFAVYAYAASVLARGVAAGRAGGGMTRDEAETMLRALVGDEAGAPLLGGGGVAGVMLGAAALFFEYDAGRGALWCGALVYRFRNRPRPGVLEAFFEEGRGAGSGCLVYREETRSLLLGRTYFEVMPGEEFAGEMKRLAAASLGWGAEVLERVASRHERDASSS
ncbi:MAG TPA: hypothetical protein VK422_03830 [Pyrinomonadaceae bacterium]|nr:hypothetical protein [Pyrinomonadaceae bacterium]